MTWVRVGLLSLFLTCSLGLAQGDFFRTGSFADVSITLRGEAAPALIEVRTDAALTQNEELRFWIYRDDDSERTFESRTVPALEPGLYRLEYPFPERGQWELNMRYGTGIDTYYAEVSSYLDPTLQETLTLRDTFYGTLLTSTPGYVQPLGFGLFALMLVLALTLVVAILRWLRRQQRTNRT